MRESIHVSVNEYDKELSWTVSFLKGLRDFCKEDENRLKVVQLLIEETTRIDNTPESVVR